jgi:hypothetical protein
VLDTEITGALRPSWAAGVQRLIGGLVLGWLAYYMLGAEEWVIKFFGCLFLIASLVGVFVLPFLGLPRRGPCPECKWPLQTVGRGQQDVLCPMCCSYFDAESDRIFLIQDPERIRDEPTYAVPAPWEDLGIVTSPAISLASSFQEAATESALTTSGKRRIWEPKWPPGCCVCRGSAERRIQFIASIVKHHTVIKEEIKIVLVGVPYCGEHDDGVDMKTVMFPDQAQNMRFGLLFRSLRYRNEFRDLNPGVFYKKE